MKNEVLNLLFLSSLASAFPGCAFKEAMNGNAFSQNPISQKQVSKISRTGMLLASWIEEDQSPSPEYQRALEAIEEATPLKCKAPLVVSKGVPDELTFTVSSSKLGDKEIQKAKVFGILGVGQGLPTELAVKQVERQDLASKIGTKPEKGLSSWKITATGLGSLLSSMEESQVTISVNLYGESETEILESVQLIVATPPSKITSEQFTLNDFETANGKVPPLYKKHMSLGQRLDLLQVVKMKSQSSYPVRATFPLKLNGQLTTHFKKTDLDQRWCAFSIQNSEWDETLSKDLYLIPFEDEIQKNILGFLNQGLQENRIESYLLPGEEKLIGIYGQGPLVQNLVTNGVQKQTLGVVQAVAGCTARCFDVVSNWDPLGIAQRFWESQGYPGGSRGCAQIPGRGRGSNDCAMLLHFQQHSQACVQCAGWELQNGIPASDGSRRFCWGAQGEAWQINKAYASVSVGTESSPIVLKLSADSTAVNVRYAFENVSESSPARVFVNFVRPETIQSQ